MSNLISNITKALKYYDTQSATLLDPHEALFPKRISSIDFDNCLSNGLFTFRRTKESYRPIAGVLPIPSRSTWELKQDSISCHSSLGYKKLQFNPTLERLDKIVSHYLKIIKNEPIAIELSGGLDTALIIEYLKLHDVDPVYVGYISDRYEFRTERAIQEYYLKGSQKNRMIDYADCPAFASLSKAPLHPFPTADSLYHVRHTMIADAAKFMGVKILLNGNAGDSLLGHSFEHAKTEVPMGYASWSITDTWTVDQIFSPCGITYLCPFAFDSTIRTLISLRKGFPEDSMKLWARKTFSNILPWQLSKFAYKANHDCWVADGLKQAASEIKVVVDSAFDFIKNPSLDSKTMIKTATNYFHAEEKEKHEFLLKLAFSVWIHGFIRENLI